jgi:hypothetical protein
MPQVHVVFYREDDGTVPLIDWLGQVEERVRAKCVTKIERLAELGHELRRPEADYLRDGIYELRTKKGHTHYRMLYFFPRECGGRRLAWVDKRRCSSCIGDRSGDRAEEKVLKRRYSTCL